MNATLNEQIAPEIVQAIITQATARGLSVNDYLRDLLGLKNGQAEQTVPRNEAMFAVLQETEEILKDMPVSGSTEDSLRILYEGRAGMMYGYESTE
jgi:hypothetical protein